MFWLWQQNTAGNNLELVRAKSILVKLILQNKLVPIYSFNYPLLNLDSAFEKWIIGIEWHYFGYNRPCLFLFEVKATFISIG